MKHVISSFIIFVRLLSFNYMIFQENLSEVKKQILTSFVKMSTVFSDSSKADDCFQKLHEMKDKHIFKALLELVDERTTMAASRAICVSSSLT